ncbi:MAG: glycosyltransferase [Actinobacteria bacterium]|nr:glycosyltransferase [Actinomycetota bacterium]
MAAEGKEGSCAVSLVATVLNEAGNLAEWWTSIVGQSRPPDEIVVVDGGSRDGTLEQLRSLAGSAPCEVRVEVCEGCNIASGRNRAIALACGGIIAVTDAGCVLSPYWLERLMAPFEQDPGTELVAGFYRPLTAGFFEEVSACTTLPLPWEVRAGHFMPSSRSLAFRREVWEAAGGYPDWLEIGEDMYFNHTWKYLGIKYTVAKDALVYWRMRRNLRALLRQYFLYARGDGEAGMYLQRHLLRFGTYGWLAFCIASPRGRRLAAPTAAAAALYTGRRWLRIPSYLEGRPAREKVAAVPCISLLMLAIDGAKMAGYLAGLARRKGR